MTLPLEDRYHEVEITCDGGGCETATYHSGWAPSLRTAYTRARLELASHHGWTRTLDPTAGEFRDYCPLCTPATLTRTTDSKELCNA